MTEREAIKLSLVAFEEINKLSVGENAICLPAEIDTAMDACRKVLAQPEQEPVIDKSAAVRIATSLGWEPKRTWVGLTDDEVSKLIDNEIGFNSCCGWEEEYARAVEAKLKEKNT